MMLPFYDGSFFKIVTENLRTAQDILDFLDEDNSQERIDFVDGFISEYLEVIDTGNEALNAFNITLKAKQHNYFELELDENFGILINDYSDINLTDPVQLQIWKLHFKMKCAMLKQENPTWPKWKVCFMAALDLTQHGLDFVGLVPGIGEIADLANGVIYTILGDGVNASLSFAAMIPVGGWAAAGVKFAKRSDNLKFIVNASNKITFGTRNSKKFREMCGLPPGDPRQAHHIISRATNIMEHEVVQKAAAAAANQGFHIDSALNGIAVAAWRNQPNHNTYNNRIITKLEAIKDANPNLSPDQAYVKLVNLLNQAKQAILNNPNTHLNDLIF